MSGQLTGATLDQVIATGRTLATHEYLGDDKAWVFDTDPNNVFVSKEMRAKIQKHPGLAGIILVNELRLSVLNTFTPFFGGQQ